MSECTPGPWRIVGDGDAQALLIVAGVGQSEIAWINFDETDDEDPRAKRKLANAALIASAPELLAACEEFVRKVEAGEARSVRSYEQMKAAIAKAKAS